MVEVLGRRRFFLSGGGGGAGEFVKRRMKERLDVYFFSEGGMVRKYPFGLQKLEA